MRERAARLVPTAKTNQCAIYTRKSTEEGLDQEFNSLDAQRESAESFIASQQHEGWVCLPDRYDDGGFSGGNMSRPALQRLMADIAAGKVSCVVVYKVDRLSRSLLDFARLIETFEKHQVSFVSVTQQFNTATSMGRLVLNVLLSFAQFEREIISERTRDKIAATRRKGKWSGGMPLLGYDVDPHGSKLVINEDEAGRVRAIFERYLRHESLLALLQELDERGWRNKLWTTRRGNARGGQRFNRSSLHRMLSNVVYIGKVRYKSEVHQGEQAGIVEPEIFEKVQAVLRRNHLTGGAIVRNKFGALLKGILFCAACNCAMTPAHTTKKKAKRYRYYVCTHAQKQGWQTCPSKSIPAGQIEAFVVDRIRAMSRDEEIRQKTVEAALREHESRGVELQAEVRLLQKQLVAFQSEMRQVAGLVGKAHSEHAVARLGNLQAQIQDTESRLTVARGQVEDHARLAPDQEKLMSALSGFDIVWRALSPKEQADVVHLVVKRIDYDGRDGKLSILFHPTGLQALNREMHR